MAIEGSDSSGSTGTVGVRELRQNLSVYLRRIKNGETLTVTDRGQPVAALGPLPTSSPLQQLVAMGAAIPPSNSAGMRNFAPPTPSGPASPSLSDVLQQLREDERLS